MSEPTRFSLSWLTADLRRIGSDLAELFALRRQLAEEEIRSDLGSARRLAIVGGVGVVLALSAPPVLLVALAMQLNQWRGGPTALWCVALGAAVLVLGLATLWLAWRRFRRDLVALRDSLAELQEDLVWLREQGERLGGD